MGIGVLDSDGSSSSSSSTTSPLALALSTSSGDENSNEVTPNLNAPKMQHRGHYFPVVAHENTIEETVDNLANNNSSSSELDKKSQTNMENSSTTKSIKHETVQIVDTENAKIPIDQNKKATTHNDISASVGATVEILKPQIITSSPGKGIRSPLATVVCNTTEQNTNQQTATGTGSGTTNSNLTLTPYPRVENVHQIESKSYSPSMPSTSRQATANLMREKQHQMIFKHLKQQQLQQYSQLQSHSQAQFSQNQSIYSRSYLPTNDDNFFLFRNSRQYEGNDCFQLLSDEMLLHIFKWLPKKALLRCSSVNKRFNSCARDETLWTRLDLGGRTLREHALQHICSRGVVILRLAQAFIQHPAFNPDIFETETKFTSKLQYLDLSMASITESSLEMLLSCCRQLKKLSLEQVALNNKVCAEIAENKNLEALNLTMCTGLEAWNLRSIVTSLEGLSSLNLSWTNLSTEAITSLVTHITPSIMRLNVAGCRRTMFDSHLANLAKRCQNIIELDLSDCIALTGGVIQIVCQFKLLEYLSISRCYLIQATSLLSLSELSSLQYLDVFGMVSPAALEMIQQKFPQVGINKFIHSSVARPTVGTRRTSIWGLRTRD